MLNVHELERSWLRYKIKHTLPYAVAGVAVITLSVAALWYLSLDRPDTKESQETISASSQPVDRPKLAQRPPVPVAQTAPTKPVPALAVSTPPEREIENSVSVSTQKVARPQGQTKVLIKPSMGFLETFKHPPKRLVQEPEPQKNVTQTTTLSTSLSTQAPVSTPVKKVDPPVQNTPTLSSSTPSNISITARQDEKDIQDVIKRFKKNKNPALSLFVAKRYYELGRYQKAYNYALITNDINSEIEDSWLIFARSLVRLDQRKMAIKALNSYIDDSDSARAKILLDDIKHGGPR